MRSLWRRFMAWWNADDIQQWEDMLAAYDAEHRRHCPQCAAAYAKENA